jgi:hypothetical protein
MKSNPSKLPHEEAIRRFVQALKTDPHEEVIRRFVQALNTDPQRKPQQSKIYRQATEQQVSQDEAEELARWFEK